MVLRDHASDRFFDVDFFITHRRDDGIAGLVCAVCASGLDLSVMLCVYRFDLLLLVDFSATAAPSSFRTVPKRTNNGVSSITTPHHQFRKRSGFAAPGRSVMRGVPRLPTKVRPSGRWAQSAGSSQDRRRK